MHDANSFLTLTYSDENLPADGGLDHTHLQGFMKRLRASLAYEAKQSRRNAPPRVRYYAAGEYGDRTWRPHYHMILFGFDFPDKVLWRRSDTGYDLFRSPRLEKLWTFGHSEIGSVTKESGGYVARYVLKKITGDPAKDHYLRPHPVTGELFQVEPEFALMSSRPGIGGEWFDKYRGDCFPEDFLVFDGRKVPVPSYYLKRTDTKPHSVYYGTKIDGTAVSQKEVIQRARRAHAHSPQHQANSTPERLAVREELAQSRLNQLRRDME